MNSFFNKLKKLNLRSIIFNLYFLPLKQAIHMPVLIYPKTEIHIHKGDFKIASSLHPAMIQIGYSYADIFNPKYEHSIITVKKGGRLYLCGRSFIGAGTRISVGCCGLLNIGNNTNITGNTTIIAQKNITIGMNSRISWECSFMDTDFHEIVHEDNKEKGGGETKVEDIIIGNHVWICSRVTVLKGSVIPDNSVVGACSLVTRKMEYKNALYAGSPVKKISENIEWNE